MIICPELILYPDAAANATAVLFVPRKINTVMRIAALNFNFTNGDAINTQKASIRLSTPGNARIEMMSCAVAATKTLLVSAAIGLSNNQPDSVSSVFLDNEASMLALPDIWYCSNATILLYTGSAAWTFSNMSVQVQYAPASSCSCGP